MKKVLYGIYEAPQNLVGWLMSRAWKSRLLVINNLDEIKELEKKYEVNIYIATRETHDNDKLLGFLSGFSIGRYICLNDSHDLVTIHHEIGHTFQSRKLGWLYLPIVGIGSAIFCNMWDRWFHKDWTYQQRIEWYYKKFPEAGADKYGGVVWEGTKRVLAKT